MQKRLCANTTRGFDWLMNEYPSDHDIPTYTGDDARKALCSKYGLPNAAPRPGESFFGDCRVLFVDDYDDGKPVAYWCRNG